MGFRLPERTATVEFVPGDEFHGLEARLNLNVPMHVMLSMRRMSLSDGEAADATMRAFGEEILLEWNAERADGTAIPATGDGFLEMPITLAIALISKWVEVATQPSAPLDGRSPAGVT